MVEVAGACLVSVAGGLYFACLAAGFMFLFLRGKKLSATAGIFGALVLIFSSYFATRYFWGVYIHSLLWIPLGLWLIDKFAAKTISAIKFIALFSCILALSILGGYPQHGVFALILMFSYVFAFAGMKKIYVIILSLVLAISLCAVQLLPTAELYRLSLRDGAASQNVFAKSMLEPKYLMSILSPDYWGSPGTNNYYGGKDYSGMNGYFGIVPLALAIMVVLKKREDKNIRFWVAVGLLGLAFSFNTIIAYLPKILNIPILNSGGAWNDLFFWQFGGAVLAAYGFNQLFKKRNRTLFFVSISLAVALLAMLYFGRTSVISVRNTGLVLVGLLLFAGSYMLKPKLAKYVALIVTAVFGLYFLFKVSPFGLSKYYYPTHPTISYLQKNAGVDRFWGFGSARIAANFPTYYKVFSPEGYDSLWPRWYGELLSSTKTGHIPENVDRGDVVIADADTPYRKRLVNLLGVKYFMDRSDDPGMEGPDVAKYPPEKFTLSKQWGETAVYKNQESFPRAFLVSDYKVVPKNRQITSFYTEDLRKTVIVSEKLPGVFGPNGTAEIVAYFPNEIKIKTESTSQNILFLSDTYYPGWKAYVNNEETKIYQADYAFRAVIVPSGLNEVRFRYQPDSFKYGLIISLAGVAVVICLFVKNGLAR